MRRVLLLTVVAAALVGVGVGAATSRQREGSENTRMFLLQQPEMIAGPDVGFRVMRWDGAVPVGQVMLRVDGKWIAARAE